MEGIKVLDLNKHHALQRKAVEEIVNRFVGSNFSLVEIVGILEMSKEWITWVLQERRGHVDG